MTIRLLSILTLSLALAGAADAAKAPNPCKVGLCRRAINHCVKQTCKHAPGVAKAACKKYARQTWTTGCITWGDAASYCGQLDANGCNGN